MANQPLSDQGVAQSDIAYNENFNTVERPDRRDDVAFQKDFKGLIHRLNLGVPLGPQEEARYEAFVEQMTTGMQHPLTKEQLDQLAVASQLYLQKEQFRQEVLQEFQLDKMREVESEIPYHADNREWVLEEYERMYGADPESDIPPEENDGQTESLQEATEPDDVLDDDLLDDSSLDEPTGFIDWGNAWETVAALGEVFKDSLKSSLEKHGIAPDVIKENAEHTQLKEPDKLVQQIEKVGGRADMPKTESLSGQDQQQLLKDTLTKQSAINQAAITANLRNHIADIYEKAGQQDLQAMQQVQQWEESFKADESLKMRDESLGIQKMDIAKMVMKEPEKHAAEQLEKALGVVDAKFEPQKRSDYRERSQDYHPGLAETVALDPMSDSSALDSPGVDNQQENNSSLTNAAGG